MRLLRADKDASLNVNGAYLEVWADMVGSVDAIGGTIVIWFTGWNWVDTVVAVGIGLWVLPRTWVLLSESLNILLEGKPEGTQPSTRWRRPWATCPASRACTTCMSGP